MPYLSDHSAMAAVEYEKWPQIKSAFRVVSSGIQTKQDELCVAFTHAEMWERIKRFHTLNAVQARKEFDLGDDGRDWTVVGAKADVSASGPSQNHICPILYRPFDIRFTYWTGRTKGFLAYPRREVMQHIVGLKNIGMIFNRQIVGDRISHFCVSSFPICHGTFYLGNKGQDYFAPLMIFDDELFSNKKTGHSNFMPEFLNAFGKAIDTEASKLKHEDIFYYAYSVFSSPSYRSRYAEFLKIDFPRLPLTGKIDLFRALAKLGSELAAFHLLESPKFSHPITEYIGGRHSEVEKISWSENTVWIDNAKTTGFNGVPEDVWNFHIGGYQVCEKWLKARKGRVLAEDDIKHYQKIIVALSETIRLMAEIDAVIEEHGGWPGAFTS
jgi:predicted helicase